MILCKNCKKLATIKFCSISCSNQFRLGYKFKNNQIKTICKKYQNGIPLNELGKMYKVSPNTIRNIIIKNDIKIRTKKQQFSLTGKIKKPTIFIKDKKFFYHHYIKLHKSTTKIAKQYNVSIYIINSRLKQYGIKIRSRYDYDGYWKNKKNPALRSRNLTNNPSKLPSVKLKKSLLYKKNPKLQLNHKLRRNKKTNLETKFQILLNKLGLIENKHYIFNKYIKTKTGFKFPDFLIIKKKIIFECDGTYWHKDKNKDKSRDIELNNVGYKVYHFNEHEINDKLINRLGDIIET